MKIVMRYFLVLLGFGLLTATAFARDPLTPAEINQLRDTAQEPVERVKLYAKFIRTRAEALATAHADPRFTEERTTKLHDLLDDLVKLIDEMDDNIDQYAAHKNDIRKPLKEVVDTDTDLQAKLRVIKQSLSDPSHREEAKDYSIVLDNCIDAVNGSLDNARKLAQEQEAQMQAEKEAKKKK